MDNKIVNLPPLRHSVIMIACLALWLAVTACFIPIRVEHWLLALLVAALFFFNGTTRRFVIALVPFALFGIFYDWMNICHNYEVNSNVDIQGLYNAEKYFFGINTTQGILTPNEFFAIHHCHVADFFAGVFYLCWVPIPILFGIWLYLNGQCAIYLHFAIVFLLVNLIGFCCYYIHPAAPPWYVANYGFDFIPGAHGEVAGLGRFDQMIGWHVFHGLYARSSNVYAALPSLHSAYTFLAFFYSMRARCGNWMRIILAVITIGIWVTAIYSSHHYIIDVLSGIACAFVGILLFEYVLMKTTHFSRFIYHYTNYISQR